MIALMLAASLSWCPQSATWVTCDVMSDGQRDRIREALSTYVLETPDCVEVRDGILAWLERKAFVFVYTAHTEDSDSSWVAGETIRDTASGRALGFGLHAHSLRLPMRQLAGIAMHEGVHLFELVSHEANAERLQRSCVR